MRLGIVGATGLVGQNFLSLLEKNNSFSIEEIRLFSRRQKFCLFLNRKQKTKNLSSAGFKGLDICFFSAGEEVSRVWAPKAVQEGVIVIDNSSAFRKDPEKLLIVPEINSHLLSYKPQIISNPNCSTIQLVLALQALHRSFGLESVHVVSLQSISGAGKQALENLKQESLDILNGKTSYEQEKISSAFNCVPYIGPFDEKGFCKEEAKIMTESRKILNRPELQISAFTVRVPSLNSHSEVIRFSLKKSAQKEEVSSALSPYVQVSDIPPHARGASGKKEVFAGRIHKDSFGKNSWLMWLVADNLLKGASLNGLQIAEKLWQIKKPKKIHPTQATSQILHT